MKNQNPILHLNKNLNKKKNFTNISFIVIIKSKLTQLTRLNGVIFLKKRKMFREKYPQL